MSNLQLTFLTILGLGLLGTAIALTSANSSQPANPQEATTDPAHVPTPTATTGADTDTAGEGATTASKQEAADDGSDDPRLRVTPAVFAALAKQDAEALVDLLAEPLQRTVATILAVKLRLTGVNAVNETLQAHQAQALAAVQGDAMSLATAVREWDDRLPQTDRRALLLALLELDSGTQNPMFPPVPDDFEFRVTHPQTRGDVAWVEFQVEHQGRMHPAGYHTLMNEDGTWRMLTLMPMFQLVLSLAEGAQYESPANYDVYAQRLTRNLLVALQQQAAGHEGDLPAPGEDGGTAELLEALGEENVKADYRAVRGGALVDAWGQPLRYEAAETEGSEGIGARLRSGGFDNEVDTADDLVVAVAAEAAPVVNPRVVMQIRLPGEDELRRVVIELFEDEATNGVRNFLNLVADGFYNGTKFHRIIDDFMIQGGDPYTRTGEGQPGTGNAGYRLPDEVTGRVYDERGLLAYANSGPNSSSCQFFITLGPHSNLNDSARRSRTGSQQRSHYTVLGRVVEGFEHVQAAGAVEVAAGPSGERSRPVGDVELVEASVVGEFAGPYAVRHMDMD